MENVFTSFSNMIDNLISDDVEGMTRSEQVIQIQEIANIIGRKVDRLVDQYMQYVYDRGLSKRFHDWDEFEQVPRDVEYTWWDRKSSWGVAVPTYYRGERFHVTGEDSFDEWVENAAKLKVSEQVGTTRVTLFINNREVETNPKAAAWKVRYKHSLRTKGKKGAAAKLHDVPMRIELEMTPNIFGGTGSEKGQENRIASAINIPFEHRVKIFAHNRLFLSDYFTMYYDKYIRHITEGY